MPIKPENKARYPKNWKQIREAILARASHRCEMDGCNALNRALGYWDKGVFVPLSRSLRDAGYDKAGQFIACSDGSTLKVIMIVLTIAHLDHTPENCDHDNLRAWCQRHHLAYDAEHHAETARKTRLARKSAHAIADMFEPTPPAPGTEGEKA